MCVIKRDREMYTSQLDRCVHSTECNERPTFVIMVLKCDGVDHLFVQVGGLESTDSSPVVEASPLVS